MLRQFERLPEGYNYFRLHPKGRGMLVARPGGIAPFTFVEEYLGEVHTGGGGVASALCVFIAGFVMCMMPHTQTPPPDTTPVPHTVRPAASSSTQVQGANQVLPHLCGVHATATAAAAAAVATAVTVSSPPGWRWFEIQDAIKKITQKELPDFYNITLERPKDDPDGYDVMFVDAAFMGSFASRMSHSCSPNCQVRLSGTQHACSTNNATVSVLVSTGPGELVCSVLCF